MDYKSRRWLAKRKAVLRRDRYQCRECRRFGIASDASVVHHAYPADDYPEYAWEDWNLISLCSACHNAMHDRESGALTDRGLAWRRRVSPPSSSGVLSAPGGPQGGSLSDGGKNDRPGPTPRTSQEKQRGHDADGTRPQTTRPREGRPLWGGKR